MDEIVKFRLLWIVGFAAHLKKLFPSNYSVDRGQIDKLFLVFFENKIMPPTLWNLKWYKIEILLEKIMEGLLSAHLIIAITCFFGKKTYNISFGES